MDDRGNRACIEFVIVGQSGTQPRGSVLMTSLYVQSSARFIAQAASLPALRSATIA